MPGFMKIFSIDDLSDGDVGRLFYAAKQIEMGTENNEAFQVLRQIILAFFEPSTRTKLGFEIACNRVGARALTFDSLASSQVKGESKKDTFKTLVALGADLLVIRQKETLNPDDFVDLPVNIVNAGDGTNEHPTQALLDCFTLLRHFGSEDLKGRKILICGDVNRSRVFHSNMKLLKRLGAHVLIMVPPIFKETLGGSVEGDFTNFEQITETFDAVMILRVQEERMAANSLDRKNYFLEYGLNFKRFEALGTNCRLMHPGPLIDGVEIDGRLAEHERSLVLTQVKMGVIVRMSLLKMLFS